MDLGKAWRRVAWWLEVNREALTWVAFVAGMMGVGALLAWGTFWLGRG